MIDALNADRYTEIDTVYKQAEGDTCGRAKPVDIVTEGHKLPLA